MDVTEVLVCECNGRAYPNRSALNTHRKSKMHQTWESGKELRDLRCLCKKLENENEALKYDLNYYRSVVQRLSSALTTGEYESDIH